MEVNVLNIRGEETGRKVALDDAIFGIEPNNHTIYLDVKQYLANRRQGTHKTKERSEVARTTRKLFRQKGTGGARRGDLKSPIVKGGGTIFGPKPRDYSQKVNKKVKRLARMSALSYKAQNDGIIVVEDFTFNAPKTKEFISVLNALNLGGVKSLFLTESIDNSVMLSARNIQKVCVQRADLVNTYKLVDAQKIVFTESGLNKLTDLLK